MVILIHLCYIINQKKALIFYGLTNVRNPHRMLGNYIITEKKIPVYFTKPTENVPYRFYRNNIVT